MPGDDPLRFVRLVTAPDAFAAKVLAARLGAEGVVWELRGGIDGPYPMGPVHVFVLARDLDVARELLDAPVLTDEDVLDDGHEDDDGQPGPRFGPGVALVLLAGTVLLMAAWAVGRVLLSG